LLLTKIEGDKLVIRLKDDSGFHFLNIDSDQIKIAITGPSLRSIGIAGSADVTAPKLTGDVIALSISGSGSIHAEGAIGGKVDVSVPGSGEVRVGDVEAKSVRAEVVGSGSIELAGKADSLNSEISGSGEIHADGLKVQTLKADVSGSGDLRAYASQAAEAVTSGSGNITVAGNPAQRKAREAGSGTVEFK